MSRTWITNVAVFDGRDLKGPSDVIVDGPVIRSVSDAAHAAPSPGDNVIDGTGLTLLPGLIDSHVHVEKEQQLRLFPTYGVTTALDMACTADFQSLIAASEAPDSILPTFRSTGIPAAAPGSMHASMFTFPKEDMVHGPEDADRFVQARIASGAAYLKVIADVPGFDQPTLDALAAAARAHGVLSVAHATMRVCFERAARAGFDVLTHMPTDAPLDDETVAQIKENNAAVVPTLKMMEHFASFAKQGDPDGDFSLDTALANLKKLVDGGVRIVAGTDSMDMPMMSIPFGKTLLEELQLMVQAGMAAKDVLRSATSDAAALFGFKDRGKVEMGLRADLLLVEGNPLEDIATIGKVNKVWIGGAEAPCTRLSDRCGT